MLFAIHLVLCSYVNLIMTILAELVTFIDQLFIKVDYLESMIYYYDLDICIQNYSISNIFSPKTYVKYYTYRFWGAVLPEAQTPCFMLLQYLLPWSWCTPPCQTLDIHPCKIMLQLLVCISTLSPMDQNLHHFPTKEFFLTVINPWTLI